MHTVKITCISENTVSFHHSLLASHGQSLFLEIDDRKYLFDTSEIYEGFMYNMENMNIRLDDVHSIILSHNHLDHSGALFKLVHSLQEQKLFLPPDMQLMKEDRYNVRYRTESKEDAIQKLLQYQHATIVNEGKKLDDHIYTTGALDADVKEQSLVLDIPNKGLVILIGCAHPTLPVIIEKAKQVTGNTKVYGIVGGLHYGKFTQEQITEAVQYIQSLNITFMIPSHCTGYNATKVIQDVLGDKVHVSSVGGQFGVGNSFTILPDLTFSLS